MPISAWLPKEKKEKTKTEVPASTTPAPRANLIRWAREQQCGASYINIAHSAEALDVESNPKIAYGFKNTILRYWA